jgi:di/tricarboxylate transporter
VSAAALALLGFLVAIALSMTARVNVGVLAISLAWVIGIWSAGLDVETLIRGFPAGLFLTLAGVTTLFAVAKSNGTLDLLARLATRLIGDRAALLPPLFFLLAGILSSIGPGAVASVAILAPLAMPIGMRAGVPNLLSAIAIGTGANAGNLSPISAVGAMVNTLLARIGLPGYELTVWLTNFLAHLIVAAGAYALFGYRLLRRPAVGNFTGREATTENFTGPEAGTENFTGREAAAENFLFQRIHWLTIAVTAVWILAVVVLRAHAGLAAFAAATILLLARAADDRDVMAGIPLDIIFMVTGVTMLIAVMERTGGMDLFTGLVARVATPATLNGVIALVTGLISTYSSTSGVVLPAFLPMVPGLVRDVGGGDPLAVALSINVGSALVDVSPLSTLGALCVATVHDSVAARDLFRKLLLWGFAMSVVGALLAGFFAGLFARL